MTVQPVTLVQCSSPPRLSITLASASVTVDKDDVIEDGPGKGQIGARLDNLETYGQEKGSDDMPEKG